MTNEVVKGLINAGPGLIMFPLSLPKYFLTPTSPGLTIAHEVKRIVNVNTYVNILNAFIILDFFYNKSTSFIRKTNLSSVK